MAYDIMGLIDPLLVDSTIGLANIFLTTTNEQLSIYLQYAVLTTIEEATFDLLVRGLAASELFNVRLDPVRLDPNAIRVYIPDGFTVVKHSNTDASIQTLQEDCLIFQQMILAPILHYHHADLSTVVDVLLTWFYCAEEEE